MWVMTSLPGLTAAALVKETLKVALQGIPPGESGQEGVIEDACKGGITGLLLADENLAKGAVSILEAVSELASELNLDGVAMLRNALRGVADVRRFIPPDHIFGIEHEIEMHFMGAGAVFRELTNEAPVEPASQPLAPR